MLCYLLTHYLSCPTPKHDWKHYKHYGISANAIWSSLSRERGLVLGLSTKQEILSCTWRRPIVMLPFLHRFVNILLYRIKIDRQHFIYLQCAHDLNCPRFTANDGTPCNFLSPYTPLPFSNSTIQKYELYSYVVLEKRPRDVAAESDSTQQWPRLVRPTLVRSKHSICRMCTNKGKLEEIVFTQAQHGK